MDLFRVLIGMLHQLQSRLDPLEPLSYNNNERDRDRSPRDTRESHDARDIRGNRDTRRDTREIRDSRGSPRDNTAHNKDNKSNTEHRDLRNTRNATRDTRDTIGKHEIRNSSERVERGRNLEKDTKTSDRDSVWTNNTCAPPILPPFCPTRVALRRIRVRVSRATRHTACFASRPGEGRHFSYML
jgi:hypothetical protein